MPATPLPAASLQGLLSIMVMVLCYCVAQAGVCVYLGGVEAGDEVELRGGGDIVRGRVKDVDVVLGLGWDGGGGGGG